VVLSGLRSPQARLRPLRGLIALASKPPKPDRGSGPYFVRRLLAGLAGARLCFGEPVHAGERTVIPVARVRARGGGGFGRGRSEDQGGGGGGGLLDAAPVGFIEVGPEGTRFEAIADPLTTARAISVVAGAAAGLVAAAAGVRALRGGRPSSPVAALLRRGPG
jgi:uncharacterized spore protein YtfJ